MFDYYQLIRSLLFQLDAEAAHTLTLKSFSLLSRCGFSSLLSKPVAAIPKKVMGLTFPNPVGLAAGMDKSGDYIDALASLDFGFLEIGTVTPRPQPGNPKPRIFRLPEHQAIINRLGFNNKGVDYLVEKVIQANFQGILGINIGKNFDTPINLAVDDYLIGLNKVYPVASYVTINISSPNTENLRQLQQGSEIENLLNSLKQEQRLLQARYGRYVPLAIKIAPDLSEDDISHIAELLIQYELDGVIATNTAINREAIAEHPKAKEAGGLSGEPLRQRSNEVITSLAGKLGGKIPIIGVGGIMEGEHSVEKMTAGASLIQLYSGLIYRGPKLVNDSITALNQECNNNPLP